MRGSIPYMFDYWANPVVHLFLPTTYHLLIPHNLLIIYLSAYHLSTFLLSNFYLSSPSTYLLPIISFNLLPTTFYLPSTTNYLPICLLPTYLPSTYLSAYYLFNYYLSTCYLSTYFILSPSIFYLTSSMADATVYLLIPGPEFRFRSSNFGALFRLWMERCDENLSANRSRRELFDERVSLPVE